MNIKASIPFEVFGNGDQVIHFAHANGFPPHCYTPMLKMLGEDHRVLAMHQRPLWNGSRPEKFKTWYILANDLIAFLDEQGLKHITGIGHSMGGIATAIAAAKRPDLFSQIILIDPVLFSNRYHYIKNMMPISWRKKKFPIAKIAMKRKDRWPSRQAAYDSLRRKKIFSLIPDDYFPYFIDGTVNEQEDGSAHLVYPKAWEVQVYCTPSSAWKYLSRIKQPTLAIRASGTNLLFAPIWQKWKRIQPKAEFHTIADSSHLVPLEKPQQIVDLITRFLEPRQP